MSLDAQVRVAVIGATGYSGEELVRRLLQHPRVDLVALTSRHSAGKTVSEVFPQFAGHPRSRTLAFTDSNPEAVAAQAQFVFLALPHGVAAEFARPLLKGGCKVIDLSADFRLRSASVYREFYGHDHPAPDLLPLAVYGLPEVNRKAIQGSTLVASPGCYPTSILLPLIPLLRGGLIQSSGVIADSLSGVSGAGRKVELDYLFCECNESVRPYGIPRHRHLSEIEEQLSLAAGKPVVIQFSPHLVPLNRGILTTLYVSPVDSLHSEREARNLSSRIKDCFEAAYSREPFVRLLEGSAFPDTKNVAMTNMIEIAWRLDPRTGRLIVMSAEDNLVKGAAGQALQSLNILCGFPESDGLM